jgi:hypothetical protein
MTPRPIFQLALAGWAVFLLCVVVEHLLEPSIDPASHQISEYVHTPTGAIVTFGFLAWAASLAATALCVWRRWQARWLTSGLLLGALGLLLTAAFATQTVAGELPPGQTLSTTGTLHNLGSGLTTLALVSAAFACLAADRRPRWLRLMTTILVCIALLATLVLLAIGPEVGGLRQRIVVAAGCLWQLSLLRALAPSRGPGPGAFQG